MRSFAATDGHDVPWLIDELVSCVAAVVDDVVVGCEDAIGDPVVGHELPDVDSSSESFSSIRSSENRSCAYPRSRSWSMTMPVACFSLSATT